MHVHVVCMYVFYDCYYYLFICLFSLFIFKYYFFIPFGIIIIILVRYMYVCCIGYPIRAVSGRII